MIVTVFGAIGTVEQHLVRSPLAEGDSVTAEG